MAIKLGISTDNFRADHRGLEYSVARIAELGAKWIEFDVITGLDFFAGQDFSPALSLDSDPYIVRELLGKHGLRCSCLSAHYPLWSHHCIDYMTKAVVFADQIGCDALATTDSEHLPSKYPLDEWMRIYKYHFDVALETAERHGVNLCVEPHGVLTNKPDTLLQIVTQSHSERMKINFDTGNTFIAGHSPPEFLEQVIDRVHHVHVKDVSHELAAAIRGESTGIASSAVIIGQGANAEGIAGCVEVLKKHGFDGVCSLECSGEDATAKSVPWFAGLIG